MTSRPDMRRYKALIEEVLNALEVPAETLADAEAHILLAKEALALLRQIIASTRERERREHLQHKSLRDLKRVHRLFVVTRRNLQLQASIDHFTQRSAT
jgi:hypothetical protein